MSMTSIQQRQT